MLDLALAKRSKNVEFNLGIGEPVLLQEQLLKEDDLIQPFCLDDLQYPTLGGHPELVRELQYLNPYKRVVITNGAKQALDAAVSFYSQDKSYMQTQGPCWPSFHTIASNYNLEFNNSGEFPGFEDAVRIVTAPGNPIGNSWTYAAREHIWDAAYASLTYGWHGDAPFAWECKVESAAKLFGLSGFRVGWLITDNEELADHAENFVELTTSGVSNPAQLAVAEMVRRLGKGELDAMFAKAHEGIGQNFKILNDVLRHYTSSSSYDGTGMFDWFRVQPEYREEFERALKTAEVLMLPGEVFLAHEPGWWRVSLGNTTDITARAAVALYNTLSDSV